MHHQINLEFDSRRQREMRKAYRVARIERRKAAKALRRLARSYYPSADAEDVPDVDAWASRYPEPVRRWIMRSVNMTDEERGRRIMMALLR